MFRTLITNIDNITNQSDKMEQMNDLSKFGHTFTLSKKLLFKIEQ